MNARPIAIAMLLIAPAIVTAQPVDGRRRVIFADLGYGSTADDEGLLGRGGIVSGGVGYRIADRLTIEAIVDRVRYYRDVEWLTFDGHAVFAGVEGRLQSRRPHVRPYLSFGYGLFRHDGIWLQKRAIGPGQQVVDERIALDGTFPAGTASGGLDCRVTDRASIRLALRLHAVFSTGGVGVDPVSIVTPAVGAAFRW